MLNLGVIHLGLPKMWDNTWYFIEYGINEKSEVELQRKYNTVDRRGGTNIARKHHTLALHVHCLFCSAPTIRNNKIIEDAQNYGGGCY